MNPKEVIACTVSLEFTQAECERLQQLAVEAVLKDRHSLEARVFSAVAAACQHGK